ncbi:Uncharacterised protein [Mycobacteroides abscessus subsp. abscessus]|nr:Uncharacterised protein [Mycobacteroides abscessus subsp. abscessus]
MPTPKTINTTGTHPTEIPVRLVSAVLRYV